MRLGDYIDSKANNGIRALNKIEAKYLKLGWPLKAGWYDRIKDTELDDAMVSELYKRLKQSGKRDSVKKSMSAILARK